MYNVVAIYEPDRGRNGSRFFNAAVLLDDRVTGILTQGPDGIVARFVSKPHLRDDGWSVVRRGRWSWHERVIDGRLFKVRHPKYRGWRDAIVQRGTPKGRKSTGSWIPWSLDYWDIKHFDVLRGDYRLTSSKA